MTTSSEPDDDSLAGPSPAVEPSLTESGRALSDGGHPDAMHAFDLQGSDTADENPVWIVIELSEEALDSTFAERITRAGFKSQPHHPSIFLRHSEVDPGALAHMMDNFVGRVSSNAAASSAKMTVLSGLGEPSLTEILTQLEPMQQFLARLKSQWLMPFIVARRVGATFQPVFTVDGLRFGQDALVRVIAGRSSATATDILEAAAQLDLSSLVDRLARVDAFTRFSNASQTEESGPTTEARGRLILHASAATLNSPAALIASLVELGRSHGVAIEQLVVNAPWTVCGEATLVAKGFYELRRLGIELSIGGGPPHADFMTSKAITNLGIELDADFVRVPADGEGFGPDVFEQVCAASPDRRFRVHATRIESAGAALAAKRAGAALISGFLF